VKDTNLETNQRNTDISETQHIKSTPWDTNQLGKQEVKRKKYTSIQFKCTSVQYKYTYILLQHLVFYLNVTLTHNKQLVLKTHICLNQTNQI
jgi:hypothetical protein